MNIYLYLYLDIHMYVQVLCTVEFLEDSQNNDSKKVAIGAGTKVSLTTGIPSIMQVFIFILISIYI
jgi:hypothetical protein